MKILVLGAAAGGGLPQWNCGCINCNEARRPNGVIKPQTQSSVAVSADGRHWALLNASPDLRQQLQSMPHLHPASLRHTPISTVLVTNGDIDHVAGLLTLRENQDFNLICTAHIHSVLAENPMFAALDSNHVKRVTIALDETFEIAPGLQARLYCVPGKVPLYKEASEGAIQTDLEGEQTVGIALTAQEKTAHYIPGCAKMTEELAARLNRADAVLFDGTVYHDDEMARAGTGSKTGHRMGHMSMVGDGGSLEAFKTIEVGRKIYVHMNNTNPVWHPGSTERRHVEGQGWTVAEDGMEISL